MLLHFDDAANLTGARLHRRNGLGLLYGIHQTLEFTCVYGQDHLPLDIQSHDLRRWELLIVKTLANPSDVLASMTYDENIAIGNILSFDFSTATQAMYRYVAGSLAAPGVLQLVGRAAEGFPVECCIQIPLLLRTTAAQVQPSNITDAALLELQIATEHINELIPTPYPSDAGKVLAANEAGTGYELVEGGTGGGVPLTRRINGYQLTEDVWLDASDVGAVALESVGMPGGVPSLDATGKVPESQLPDTATNDIDESTITKNLEQKLQAIGVKESNAGRTQRVWIGTLVQYNEQHMEESSDICFVVDDASDPRLVLDIDAELDPTSIHAIQNQAVTRALEGKANLVAGKVPAVELPDMDYVPLTRTVNGYELDSDIVLDASDVGAISTIEKGAAGGVATLDAEGKVPPGELPALPYLPTSGGNVTGAILSTAGGYSQSIYTIPAAVSNYILEPGKVYRHSPSAASTYTLPDIADASATKDIAISVAFSADALSCAFVDAQGTIIPMLRTPDIAAGQTYEFECTYNGGWKVLPVSMEVEE